MKYLTALVQLINIIARAADLIKHAFLKAKVSDAVKKSKSSKDTSDIEHIINK